MKWNKISEITRLQSPPSFANEHILCLNMEDELCSFTEKNLEKASCKKIDKNAVLNISDHSAFLFHQDSISILSESTLDETLVWRAEFGRPFIYNSTYYYEQLFDRKSKALQIGIYKRIDGKEKWKKEFTDSRFILNVTEYLLISDIGLKHIKRIDLDNGTELWNYTLPEGKITGNLYVYDNILVIPSIAGQLPFEKTFLRGINIISGELVWERESNIYLYQDRNIGLLHSFGEDIYIVINPQTGEQIIRKEFTGIKEKHRLSVYSNMCSLYGDGLYFTSDYVENYYDCQFGKINIQTHEIEFIQRLDVPAGTTGHPPIYHNRRLYIKDSSNTLHIYERGNYN